MSRFNPAISSTYLKRRKRQRNWLALTLLACIALLLVLYLLQTV